MDYGQAIFAMKRSKPKLATNSAKRKLPVCFTPKILMANFLLYQNLIPSCIAIILKIKELTLCFKPKKHDFVHALKLLYN